MTGRVVECPAEEGAAGADPGPPGPGPAGPPPPAPIDPYLTSADLRMGYARRTPRHAGFTVGEMKRLGRDAAELTAPADHLTAHGLVLEKLAGPLPGIYEPTGHGKLLFAFFAALAETERENIRQSTLEGLDTAARKGKHGGRPPEITDDMLPTVLRRRAGSESVEQIQPDLIIPTGKGRNPSVVGIYRALAEHAKREAYLEAVEQGHADFAVASGEQGRLRRSPPGWRLGFARTGSYPRGSTRDDDPRWMIPFMDRAMLWAGRRAFA